MPPKIALEGVTKLYSGTLAVDDISLDIETGSFTSLLGPSGCGKTTTLRMIAGLEEPDKGEMRIGDRLVFSKRTGVFVAPSQRTLGFIFQSYALWPHMTVAQNISFGLEGKVPRNKLKSRVEEVLAQVRLQGLGGRYPSELSGGQQQRVALARTLATEPEILLLDEPLSNLDAKLRTQMRAELKRIHSDLGITIVYVTHDQLEALTLSTKIAVMKDGVIEQYASPLDVYRHPQSLFVAEFVGNPQANLIPGTIESRQGSKVAVLPNGQCQLPDDFPATGEVMLGIRPEDIRIERTRSANAIQATVYAVMPAGSDVFVDFRIGDVEIVARQPRDADVTMDEDVWLGFDPQDVNVFDRSTEQLINAAPKAQGLAR